MALVRKLHARRKVFAIFSVDIEYPSRSISRRVYKSTNSFIAGDFRFSRKDRKGRRKRFRIENVQFSDGSRKKSRNLLVIIRDLRLSLNFSLCVLFFALLLAFLHPFHSPSSFPSFFLLNVQVAEKYYMLGSVVATA